MLSQKGGSKNELHEVVSDWQICNKGERPWVMAQSVLEWEGREGRWSQVLCNIVFSVDPRNRFYPWSFLCTYWCTLWTIASVNSTWLNLSILWTCNESFLSKCTILQCLSGVKFQSGKHFMYALGNSLGWELALHIYSHILCIFFFKLLEKRIKKQITLWIMFQVGTTPH